MSRRKYATSADRIRANVEIDPETGCWNWTRRINRGGYGTGNHFIDGARVTYRAHRLSYEAFVGPVPPGLSLDHLCRNRKCANPDHLEPVPQRTNLMRAPASIAARNAAKTHCKQGHPFDAENTRLRLKSGRTCRACERNNDARRRASIRSERAA